MPSGPVCPSEGLWVPTSAPPVCLSPSTSLSLPCSSLSPVDSHLPNGVGGGMGRGSLAVGGKLQASLFGAPAAVASAPSREGSWSQEGDNQACSRGPRVCREQLSLTGSFCRPVACAVPCAAALALLPPELVPPQAVAPTPRMLPCPQTHCPPPTQGPEGQQQRCVRRQGLPPPGPACGGLQAHPRLWVGWSPLASSPQPLGAWPAVGQMTTPAARWAGGGSAALAVWPRRGRQGAERMGGAV